MRIRRSALTPLLAMPVAIAAVLSTGSRADAGQHQVVFVTVPTGSISGVVSYGYYNAPSGKSIVDVALHGANLCQVVEVKQLGNSTVRVGFQSPPGSLIGPPWGGYPCGAYLDVVLE